ncbi:MAG TPA: hypothetical protein VFG14_18920, partial [Chthoniobacteraceae bacterium]|nr:hypothetical protein [Chthoniobacteraceae bacterium]
MSRTALIWTILAGLLILAVAWIFVVAPYWAEQRWESARASLEAKGEKLSLADFPRPRGHGEENFFFDSLWQANSRWARTKTGFGFARLRESFAEEWDDDILNLGQFDQAKFVSLKEKFPEFSSSLAGQIPSFMMQNVWAQSLKKPGSTQRAAELIFQIQAPAGFFIDRLRELSSRPEAWFPADYTDELSIAASAPPVLKDAAVWLELRVNVMLALGKHHDAFEDVLLIFRFQQALQNEFVRDSFLLEMDLTERGTHLINRGILRHAWTAEELRAFDKELKTVNAPARLAQALRNQRALMLDVVWPSIRSGSPIPYEDRYSKYVPGYWFYQTLWLPGDQLTYSQAIQQMVEALDAVPAKGMNARTIPDWRDAYPDRDPKGAARLPKFMTWEWGPSRLH